MELPFVWSVDPNFWEMDEAMEKIYLFFIFFDQVHTLEKSGRHHPWSLKFGLCLVPFKECKASKQATSFSGVEGIDSSVRLF